MIMLYRGGKKIKLIILFIVIILISAGVFYYLKYPFSKDGKPEFLLEVATEKGSYVRGEQLRFVVRNNGTKAIWYVVPPAKCKSEFSWNIFFENEKVWSAANKYPKCAITKEDYDLIEIKTLAPNESIDGLWDQRSFSENIESRYAEPGKYKIAFYYSDKTINKSDVRGTSDLDGKSAISLEFEIGDSYFDDSIKNAVQRENDAERRSDLGEIKKALETYAVKTGKYPDSNSLIKLSDKNSGLYKILSEYLNEESLSDPNHPEYYYGYSLHGSEFELSARFENVEDDDCEMVSESLCIYKIDSLGNVSKKKYPKRRILTVGESVDVFISRIGIFEGSGDIIMITSDVVGDGEKALIEEANAPENVKVVRASEIRDEDLLKNNLVVIGNAFSNSLIKDLLKKTSIIEIADSVDLEKNNIKAAFRFAKSPYDNEKNVLIVDLGYSFGAMVRLQGSLKSEKDEEFFHVVFHSKEGEDYALVQSFEKNSYGIGNMGEFEGKNIELYGYKRIWDSPEFPVEDSIGVIEISILDDL